MTKRRARWTQRDLLLPASVVCADRTLLDAVSRRREHCQTQALDLPNWSIAVAPPFVLVRAGQAQTVPFEDDLPWTDGAIYLGHETHGLYLPTSLALDVPAELFRDALRLQAKAADFLVLPDWQVLSVHQWVPVTDATLASASSALAPNASSSEFQ